MKRNHQESERALNPSLFAFHRQALQVMNASGLPYLVGGAYALRSYTGVVRHTKDLDLFVHRADCPQVLECLANAGYRTEITDPIWLAKAFYGEDFVDIIFSSGKGIARVDDEWFTHAVEAQILDVPVRLCPVEEMIWSKAFVAERERYDGADIAHLLHEQADWLDWQRLLRRFGPHWRVLFSYLILFGFIYPSESQRIPAWVMQELLDRMQQELQEPPSTGKICQGTLLSHRQFLIDVEQWGYEDARGELFVGDAAGTAVYPERQIGSGTGPDPRDSRNSGAATGASSGG